MDNDSKKYFDSLETLIKTNYDNLKEGMQSIKDTLKDLTRNFQEDHDKITRIETNIAGNHEKFKELYNRTNTLNGKIIKISTVVGTGTGIIGAVAGYLLK